MTDHLDAQLAADLAHAAGVSTYLVWSNKQHAWWGPGGCRYTQDIWQAGRYTLEDAELACRMRTWEPGKVPPEVAVVAPESGRNALSLSEIQTADARTRRLAEEITLKAMRERAREVAR